MSQHDAAAQAEPTGSSGPVAAIPEVLAAVVDKLCERVDGHRQWLENLGAEVAAARQTPSAYTELVARLHGLEQSSEHIKRLADLLSTIVESHSTPQLTVRHYRSAAGLWDYETTVSIKPETATALSNTLEFVDNAARAESARRANVDAGRG